jgi:hypothetical protein
MIISILSKTCLVTVIPALPLKHFSTINQTYPDSEQPYVKLDRDTTADIITNAENLQEIPNLETKDHHAVDTEPRLIKVSLLDDAEAVLDVAGVLDPSTK